MFNNWLIKWHSGWFSASTNFRGINICIWPMMSYQCRVPAAKGSGEPVEWAHHTAGPGRRGRSRLHKWGSTLYIPGSLGNSGWATFFLQCGPGSHVHWAFGCHFPGTHRVDDLLLFGGSNNCNNWESDSVFRSLGYLWEWWGPIFHWMKHDRQRIWLIRLCCFCICLFVSTSKLRRYFVLTGKENSSLRYDQRAFVFLYWLLICEWERKL